MVAINFTVFQDKILSGEKRQTVRLKARCKPGDRLQLYTGMRTKACRKLGDAVCWDVFPVVIAEEGLLFGRIILPQIYREVYGLDPEGRSPTQVFRANFAHRDGFSSFDACVAFFRERYGTPFRGQVIVWQEFQPAEGAL